MICRKSRRIQIKSTTDYGCIHEERWAEASGYGVRVCEKDIAGPGAQDWWATSRRAQGPPGAGHWQRPALGVPLAEEADADGALSTRTASSMSAGSLGGHMSSGPKGSAHECISRASPPPTALVRNRQARARRLRRSEDPITRACPTHAPQPTPPFGLRT